MIQTPIPTPPPVPMPPGLDPNYVFGELMPLVAIVTMVIVGAIALRWLFRTPVGEALAQRIRYGKAPRGEFDSTGQHAHAELEARVSELQDHVGELAERLDFTERLLADRRERRVGPGE
jgi:hypothetical protein